ncbi:hypothetical protein B0J15DRAFT_516477 [Fusarium solani]|uniref:DUF7703 domain-containing protein n=1 Tax=Fusarium solani TaxID=169388 RepID=A0A9P9JUW2_FUSSL|nr:uncharacterized protein B0J15DRAFT_516477 [Fusarium solani]KAH7237883.1 hypothetical protein B0J15DRAFT_516477 [Fusarium solani]
MRVVTPVIVAFISIALYNVLELNFSFLVATWGIAPNAIGYLLKHLALTDISNLYSTLIIIGWCTMVTGQSVVLYSRPFIGPYSVYEKLQLTVFFIQETVISGLYIWETLKLLRTERDLRGRTGPRRVMNHLIYVNIVVILLDITVVALEFANLYDVQTAYKPLVYIIKLKIEFSILGRLVELTQSSTRGSSYTRSGTAAMALDTFAADGAGGSRRIDLEGIGETHVSGERNDRNLEPSTTTIVRTTEITVQSDPHWRSRDQDMECLNGKSGITTKSIVDEEGPSSSASSERHFASDKGLVGLTQWLTCQAKQSEMGPTTGSVEKYGAF